MSSHIVSPETFLITTLSALSISALLVMAAACYAIYFKNNFKNR